MKWRFIFFCFFLTLAGVSTSALAKKRPPHEKGWYAGVSATYNDYQLVDSDLNYRSTVVIENPAETTVDSRAVGFSLFGGFRYSQYLAFEAGLLDFGTAHYHLGYRSDYPSNIAYLCGIGLPCPPAPAPPRYAPSDYSFNGRALHVLVKGSLPIHDRWSLDASVGATYSQWRASDGSNDRNTDSDQGPVFALGAAYAITPQLRMHAEWSKHVVTHPGSYAAASYAPASGLNGNHGAFREGVTVSSLGLSVEYRL